MPCIIADRVILAGKEKRTVHKKIFVSLCGYLPSACKTAVCTTGSGRFSVYDVKNRDNAYVGLLSEAHEDPESGETIRIADFSSLKRTGEFVIKCGYRVSDPFIIADDAYAFLKKLVISGIHYNRCGYDFSLDAAGMTEHNFQDFIHPKCHSSLTGLYFGDHSTDVTGGWHCGGTYGKYTCVAALTCAFMLYAYQLYPNSFASDGSACDILDECRWGLEWLLKMQSPDGGVSHKFDTSSLPAWPEPPHEDSAEYFIFPASVQSTILFTAVTALAARVFSDKDVRFSRQLSRAATNSWIWLVNSPGSEPWALPSGASASGHGDIPDNDYNDDMMWAAAEMYALTGNESFSKRFSELAGTADTTGFAFNSTGGFGAVSYLMNGDKKDRSLLFFLKKKIGDRADKLISSSPLRGFGTALCAEGRTAYNEYSNMTVLSDCIVCELAYMIFGMDKYLNYAASMIHYLLGKNPMGISYITGSTKDSPHRPHHAMSRLHEHSFPLPGLVVCGPNRSLNDEYSNWRLRGGTPPGKCYIDSEFSISTNEPSVAFSAAAAMASAFFDELGSSTFDKIINT